MPNGIDDRRIGIICSYNPSLKNYIIVNAGDGTVEHQYTGRWLAGRQTAQPWLMLAYCNDSPHLRAQTTVFFGTSKSFIRRDVPSKVRPCPKTPQTPQSGLLH